MWIAPLPSVTKKGKYSSRTRSPADCFSETMVGKSLMPCHSDHSRGLIGEMLATGNTHCYTITKKGRKKLVYQTPWKQDGEVAGLVEISFYLPETMVHYDRDKGE